MDTQSKTAPSERLLIKPGHFLHGGKINAIFHAPGIKKQGLPERPVCIPFIAPLLQRSTKVAVRGPIHRVCRKCIAIARNRLVIAFKPGKRISQIVVSLGESWRLAQAHTIGRDSLLVPILLTKNQTKIAPSLGKIWRISNSGSKTAFSRLQLVCSYFQISKIVMRRCIVRLAADCFPEAVFRISTATEDEIGVSQVIMRFGIVRLFSQ